MLLASVTLPAGVSGTLTWGGRTAALVPGPQRITLE